MSIIPYLRALRLRRAEELLKDSSGSVAEVAYAMGFDNPRYFSRDFSEEKGALPVVSGKWRGGFSLPSR